MQLQPVKTHILVRFYNPPDIIIQAASKQFEGDTRTRVEVLAIGPDVKCCKVGDFLFLIPKPLIAPIDGDDVLIDEAHVLGIVIDDTRPLQIVE